MRHLFAGTAALALLLAVQVQAAPILYTGEVVIGKVSGGACTPDLVGQSHRLELVLDHDANGSVSGYFSGADITTGKFAGSDAARLTVVYPFYGRDMAEGHSLSLTVLGDGLTGTIRERHLDQAVDACNWDEADLKLSRSNGDVLEWLARAEKRYAAAAMRSEAQYWLNKDDFVKATPLYEKALQLIEEAEGKSSPRVVIYLNGLTVAYSRNNQPDKAIALLERRVSDFTVDEAKGLQEALADLYYKQGSHLEDRRAYPEAVSLFEKAVNINRLIRPPDAAAGLLRLAYCYEAQCRFKEAEENYKECIPILEKEVGPESKEVAIVLNFLAELYEATGNYAEVAPLYKRALAISEKTLGPDHPDVATGLNNLAGLYKTTGHYAEAEPLFKRALAIREKSLSPDHPDVTTQLNNLALLYHATGRYAEAKPLYKRALAIWEKSLGLDHPDVATGLNNLAGLYKTTGHYAEAEALYKRALAIDEKALGPDHAATAVVLNNLAGLYLTTGRYAEAEPLYKRALAIGEKTLGPDHPDVATRLNDLALLYDATGRYAEAEPLHKRALAISEKTLGPDHPDVATRLNNLAELYRTTGRYSEAEPLCRRALTIGEKSLGPDHPNSATWLNNLALLYDATGRYAEAEPLYKRALAIVENALGPHHPAVATRLNNLAALYQTTGRYAEAEPLYKRAFRIARAGGDPDLLRLVLNNYSIFQEDHGNPEAAIFFGKQAVNTIQSMRRNIAGLGKETLKGFDDTVEYSYRNLSRLLIARGRLPEAERVMELLKEQEFFQFVRRTGNAASGQAPMTSFEAVQDRLLAEAGEPLASIHAELQPLAEKSTRTPDEEARFKELTTRLEKADAAFTQVLEKVVTTLSAARADKGEELKEAQGLQDTLRELGDGTVALYTLVDKESYTLILITPEYRRVYTTSLKGVDLNARISAFRALLKNPALDPRPLGHELLDIVLPPAARKELAEARAQTLMWHLDGPLRYLPLGALHDGTRYLTESYRNTLFTSASKDKIKDQPKGQWKGLGLGVSQPRTVAKRQFGALPSVPAELSTVIGKDGQGVIPGDRYLDAAFTWELLQGKLKKKGNYPLIHIASHFSLEPGNDTQSFLLPGSGEPITLALINQQNNLFGGVDLLTLSACETGIGGGKAADGKEVDGLSILAQRQGAKAVIATLWPVADDSTALLMQQFYRLRETRQLPKAEALRQAQLALLNGKVSVSPDAVQRSALRLGKEPAQAVAGAKPFPTDPDRPYAHPYFWAPFVLMGNWK